MVAAGPAAVVTEVGWIENQGVLMSRKVYPEAVIVEMLVAVLGAVKSYPGLPSINDYMRPKDLHTCV